MLKLPNCKQLTYPAAILAVAVLCAQTLGVVHDHHHAAGPFDQYVSEIDGHEASETGSHDVSETELCAVCSAPAQHADSSSAADAGTPRFEQQLNPAPTSVATIVRTSKASLARAPPTV